MIIRSKKVFKTMYFKVSGREVARFIEPQLRKDEAK